MNRSQKSELLYAYYGDDFTGSTDVLEGLALHGVPAVLFTREPDRCDLAAFAGCRAIGIAGESRSRTPGWMSRHLPRVFAKMRILGAPVNHYKVCSTFDSSPQTGSIGKAIELGMEAFRTSWIPVVVGAPRLGRAVAFANLFATALGEMHRIDRHPTMRRHPVTPMFESDLRLHLARQTDLPIGLVDVRAFQSGTAGKRLSQERAAGARVVVFDGIDDCMLEETASLVWREARQRPVFSVGSSGFTYGLLGYWQRQATALGLPKGPARLSAAVPCNRILVLSGSCSPATARQIRMARQQGFTTIRLPGAGSMSAEMQKAQKALRSGQSVALYTALGPAAGKGEMANFGAPLGNLLRRLLLSTGVRRVLIAGGDTSSHAVKQLGLTALTFAAPLVAGAPLCLAHAAGSPLDGLEFVLKGGQIGPEDFFMRVREGRL